jgi:hypothetical protein
VGAIIRPGEEDPLAEKANKDGVALTSLGQFLTHIPFDLRVGRMVAFGAIVGKYPFIYLNNINTPPLSLFPLSIPSSIKPV